MRPPKEWWRTAVPLGRQCQLKGGLRLGAAQCGKTGPDQAPRRLLQATQGRASGTHAPECPMQAAGQMTRGIDCHTAWLQRMHARI